MGRSNELRETRIEGIKVMVALPEFKLNSDAFDAMLINHIDNNLDEVLEKNVPIYKELINNGITFYGMARYIDLNDCDSLVKFMRLMSRDTNYDTHWERVGALSTLEERLTNHENASTITPIIGPHFPFSSRKFAKYMDHDSAVAWIKANIDKQNNDTGRFRDATVNLLNNVPSIWPILSEDEIIPYYRYIHAIAHKLTITNDEELRAAEVIHSRIPNTIKCYSCGRELYSKPGLTLHRKVCEGTPLQVHDPIAISTAIRMYKQFKKI